MLQAPEDLPSDPHDKGWLIKIKMSGAPGALLSASDYERYIKDEANK
jgi:glycine cleavage system H lipoate-binding protein